jgi:hypothetical protein
MEPNRLFPMMRTCEAGLVRGSLRSEKKSRNVALFVSVILVASPHCLLGQESSRPLSPSESCKAAIAPFTETRNQANDLTDADKFALGIGIAQASRDCVSLASDISAFAGNPKELFALGQPCIFGQQFESARAALVEYLALPQPPQREQALSLLVRACLGLREPGSAEAQLHPLLRDDPYDPLIHFDIEQVIENTEGAGAYLNDLALRLCAIRSPATLPLLAAGKILEGKDGSASAATLFADAVRCAALERSSNKPYSLDDLAAIVRNQGWAGTADLALMQAALERRQMVGNSAPLSSLRGYMLGTSSLVHRTVSLKRASALLVVFTLWAPGTPEIANDLAKFIPRQSIYAITSWQANTGREDVRSSEVLQGIRSWQRSLPKTVSLLIVPDSVLRERALSEG